MKSDSQHLDLLALRVEGLFFVSPTQKFHMTYGVFDTEFGEIMMAIYDDKVAVAEFGSEPSFAKNISYERDDRKVKAIIERGFDLLLIGTTFQHKVWEALMTIKKGETISYSQLAASMGIPTATRAVASAVARNKIAYFVPCHRVTPIDASVGNYRWGASIKQQLLITEK